MQKLTPSDEPWKVPDKTPVRPKTLNPTWNTRMMFTTALDSAQAVAAPDKVIAIVCGTAPFIVPILILSVVTLRSYDWNQLSDPEFMGQVVFAISSVPEVPTGLEYAN